MMFLDLLANGIADKMKSVRLSALPMILIAQKTLP